MSDQLDDETLKFLIGNWKNILKSPDFGKLFKVRNSLGSLNIVQSFVLKNPELEDLLSIDGLKKICIIMGCNQVSVGEIKDIPIFTPIICGILRNGNKVCFKMDFYPDVGGIHYIEIGRPRAIEYVQEWQHTVVQNKFNEVFESTSNGVLKYYTFNATDTGKIKTFYHGRDTPPILYFHLGLDSNPDPKEDNPFKFRTVLEIQEIYQPGVVDNPESEFYQLSSPCPHNCGYLDDLFDKVN